MEESSQFPTKHIAHTHTHRCQSSDSTSNVWAVDTTIKAGQQSSPLALWVPAEGLRPNNTLLVKQPKISNKNT